GRSRQALGQGPDAEPAEPVAGGAGADAIAEGGELAGAGRVGGIEPGLDGGAARGGEVGRQHALVDGGDLAGVEVAVGPGDVDHRGVKEGGGLIGKRAHASSIESLSRLAATGDRWSPAVPGACRAAGRRGGPRARRSRPRPAAAKRRDRERSLPAASARWATPSRRAR